MTEPSDLRKQAAAREAAARFATDLPQAVTCYAALIGYPGTLDQPAREALEEELCSLLPPFRHPVHDASSEYILFFDPAGLPAAESPPSLPPMIADDNTWLAEELRCCLQMLALWERQGMTPAIDGYTTIRTFRQQRAYRLYVRLVRSKGMGRKEALQTVRALYGCADDKEALLMLKDGQEEVVRRWQKGAPCLVETILSRWRGLLPET